MNPIDQNEVISTQVERCNELVADFHLIEPCISMIQNGRKKLSRDISEILFLISTDKCRATTPGELRDILTAYTQGSELLEEILKVPGKHSRLSSPEQMKLACLSSLCDYDTENGTTYAIYWATLLCRLVCQIAAINNVRTPLQSTNWLILDAIGSMVLSKRRPKHFSFGLRAASLEIVLLIDRSVALLSTPLAVVLSMCEPAGTEPDFMSASEHLKVLSISKLRSLWQQNASARSLDIHDDLMNWRYNSSFRGRCGLADSRRPAAPAASKHNLGDLDLVDLLAIFDEVCETQWSDFARTYFDRLHAIALDRKYS